MAKKKRTAYPALTAPEAREKQRIANARYSARHPHSERRARDIERLGLTEYNRRGAAKSRRWRELNVAAARAVAARSRATPKYAARMKKWRKSNRAINRDRLRLKARSWWARNRDRVNAQRRLAYRDPETRTASAAANRESYLRHREARIASVNAWKTANPQKSREITKRGVLKRRAIRPSGRYTKASFHARCDYFGWKCIYCRAPLSPATVTIEHQIPLSRGGANWPSNLAPACWSCNKRKHAKTVREWLHRSR